MTDAVRIIIVEDNLPLARAIARNLAREGYATEIAPSAAELRRIYRNQGADLVLLDLNLGADDGMDLARELAETSPVAVIIMTDYLVKPFAQDELSARVRAVLRRRLPQSTLDGPLRLGPCQLDLGTRSLHCEGLPEAVELTERESTILERLMRCAGRPVGRGDLGPRSSWGPGDRSVDVHVGHLRRKLAEAGVDALNILSVRGHGYRLTLKDEESRGPDSGPVEDGD
jgi:DNA-binding response OmpR family regulator